MYTISSDKNLEVNYTFNAGPFVEIRGSHQRKLLSEYGEFYKGNFYDPRHLMDFERDVNSTWGVFRQWYTDWFINIYEFDENEGFVLVSNHIYCDINKNVAIILDTDSLYETRIWLDKCIQYKNKRKCNLFVFTTFFDILKKFNEENFRICPKETYFSDPIERKAYCLDYPEFSDLPDKSTKEFTWQDELGYYATYKIGRYPIAENGCKMYGEFMNQNRGLVKDGWKTFESYRNPINWNNLSPEEIANHILGLDHDDLENKIDKLTKLNYLNI